MPVTKCNCLPYPQNATPAQKCMRGGGALVAITTFVVGLLGLLTSLNLLSTALGPIGTIGSGCMLGGGFLILAALYLTRGKEDKSGLGLKRVSQVSGSVSVSGSGPNQVRGSGSVSGSETNEEFNPAARQVASDMCITDLKGRLHENYRGQPLDISLIAAPNTDAHAHKMALQLLFMDENTFLRTPFSFLGNETSPPYNILLEALAFRCHSFTYAIHNDLFSDDPTFEDIPYLTTEGIFARIRDNRFPNQAFFCLTPKQVNDIFQEIYIHQPMDTELLRKNVPHLFPSYPIGKYADAHMKRVLKGIDVRWRSVCLYHIDPRVRVALENDLNRS